MVLLRLCQLWLPLLLLFLLVMLLLLLLFLLLLLLLLWLAQLLLLLSDPLPHLSEKLQPLCFYKGVHNAFQLLHGRIVADDVFRQSRTADSILNDSVREQLLNGSDSCTSFGIELVDCVIRVEDRDALLTAEAGYGTLAHADGTCEPKDVYRGVGAHRICCWTVSHVLGLRVCTLSQFVFD